MSATQVHIRPPSMMGRPWLVRAAICVVVLLCLGWFYGWATRWCFPPNTRVGFGYGMLHGAVMPMALPSLALGNDVEIYATNNSGRPYKLGYIVGINLCGLLFFGSAFWRPARQAPSPDREPAGES